MLGGRKDGASQAAVCSADDVPARLTYAGRSARTLVRRVCLVFTVAATLGTAKRTLDW